MQSESCWLSNRKGIWHVKHAHALAHMYMWKGDWINHFREG